jgi:predicted extracellular nuclease
MADQVAGATEWHINADEPRMLDYNTEYKSDAQIDSLYSSHTFRASDHDPVFIGLQLADGATASLYAVLGDAANKRKIGKFSITHGSKAIECD